MKTTNDLQVYITPEMKEVRIKLRPVVCSPIQGAEFTPGNGEWEEQ